MAFGVQGQTRTGVESVWECHAAMTSMMTMWIGELSEMMRGAGGVTVASAGGRGGFRR